MEKKIIGYKLIKPEYVEAVKTITGSRNFNFEGFEKEGINNYTVVTGTLKRAGVLDLWFEPVYEEEQFKENDWLYFETENIKGIVRFNGLTENSSIITKERYILAVRNNEFISQGKSDNYTNKNNVKKATPEQIQEILTIVAKAKGFVKGINFKNDYILQIKNDYTLQKGCVNSVLNGNFRYLDYLDMLEEGGSAIYCKGKWAEIVKDELPVIDSYKGKIVDNAVVYGCNGQYKLNYQDLTNILEFLNVWNIGKFEHTPSNRLITKKDIEQMLKALNNH